MKAFDAGRVRIGSRRRVLKLERLESRLLLSGQISGGVWADTNGDGAWDSGEPGLEGWTVYLDANDNGVPDGGDAVETTGSGGSYSFSGLSAGTHTVRVVWPEGWERTFPSAFDFSEKLDITLTSALLRDFSLPSKINMPSIAS